MKNNRNVFANWDRDSVCFMIVVLMCLGLGATVVLDFNNKDFVNQDIKELKKTKFESQDGTCTKGMLPERTNTGDTLYVLQRKRGNRIYAQQPNGNSGVFKIDGADRVSSGDTIVYNSKHMFLMKNITQRNLERQK